jgi:hypothetical protein
MNQLVFTEVAVERLFDLATAPDKETWELFKNSKSPVFGSLTKKLHMFEAPFPDPGIRLVKSKGKEHFDLKSAIRLHQGYPDLTRVQARDPRFWVYLAHVTHWDYMRSRWDVGSQEKSQRAYLKSRYFVAQKQSRALMRHGIARLWWAAALTHAPKRSDPYELTAVLLSKLDIAQQILERNFGRNEIIRRTFLDFIQKNEETMQGNKGRQCIRQLAKALNAHGGVTLLDWMTKADVTSFLKENLNFAVSQNFERS